MNKYLFITDGGAYVFEAEDDKGAAAIVVSYLREYSYYCSLSLLARITGGLQVENVEAPEDFLSNETPAPISYGETGWEILSVGEAMITQLQPFSEQVREKRLLAIREIEERERKVRAMPLPKVGDDIYIPPALYLGHGRDDRMGGLAKVVSVSVHTSGGDLVHDVCVEEFPSSTFVWEYELAGKQDELREIFGENRAYPDPDNRPKFNEW